MSWRIQYRNVLFQASLWKDAIKFWTKSSFCQDGKHHALQHQGVHPLCTDDTQTDRQREREIFRRSLFQMKRNPPKLFHRILKGITTDRPARWRHRSWGAPDVVLCQHRARELVKYTGTAGYSAHHCKTKRAPHDVWFYQDHAMLCLNTRTL